MQMLRCNEAEPPSRKTGLARNRKRATQAAQSDTGDIEDSNSENTACKKVRWEGESDELNEGEGEESEESASTDEKICLAASCQFGRIGCAYYDPVKSIIYIFEDAQENQHFDMTKTLVEQASPDVIVTSSKADDDFMDVLRDRMDVCGGIFQIRPHKDFSPLKGRDRILSLRILSELPFHGTDDRINSEIDSGSEPQSVYDLLRRRKDASGDPIMQKWNASIRLANHASIEDAPLCLGSVGALLDHLARVRAVGDLEDEGVGGLEIRGIETLIPAQCMQINADALFSLQVFEDENHASIHSDKTKEGLSLFGILNNTKTTLGRALLREWFFRPSLSLAVINARHDAVACFLRPENQVTAGAMQSHLNGIKNVPRTLGVLRAGKAKLSDWQGIVKFTFHSIMLRDCLGELSHAKDVGIVKKLLTVLDVGSFRGIGNMVHETIAWEESATAGRVCVKPHIDEELDNMKHVYNGIDTILSTVAQQISSIVPPDYASSLNVVYFPQLGFLTCVPMLEEWKNDEEITVLEGWSFQFSSESHVYFKSPEMRDMDVHIGDLHPAIVDREIEIVQSLKEKILEYGDAMGHACDVCAELDCLLSLAEASRTYDYRRPQMTEKNVLDIKQGRHPLQELVVDSLVPNDAFVVGGAGVGTFNTPEDSSNSDEGEHEHNSIVICTGANASGKSVYLKQIALIQYMAQIGCFVPADSATLGVVDKIFTRVQTRESVSKVQSAFMIDLNQVSFALRNATERSLILLDEFGKGTLSSDGAGLFCGVINHLARRGAACPKVIAATHFHDVFSTGLLPPGQLRLTMLHMQVLLTNSHGEVLGASADADQTDASTHEDEGETIPLVGPAEQITYLYRIAKGLSLDSHAAICAEVFGIPRAVAQRARYVSKLLVTHELGKLLDEEMDDDERRALEEAEEVCRRFLAWDLARDGERVQRSVKEVLAEVLGR
ncbi:muts domain V-domain-containing protein [Amylocystis lapponica]|nr:muts domain V-domain-containing protein [Amylocystis lapponica]